MYELRKNWLPALILAGLFGGIFWLQYADWKLESRNAQASLEMKPESMQAKAGDLEPERIESFNLRTGEAVKIMPRVSQEKLIPVPDPKFGGEAVPVDVLPTKKLLTLPEDANTWHVSLFVQPDWQDRPRERKAVDIFSTEQWAIDLRHSTHWHLTPVNSLEARKFWKWVPETPCLIIQDAGGSMIYREANPDLWSHPTHGVHSLKREIQGEVNRKKRHGNQCPGPDCPDNQKPDQEKGQPPAGDEVDARKDKETIAPIKKKGVPFGIAALLMGGSLAFAIVGAKAGIFGAKFAISRGSTA